MSIIKAYRHFKRIIVLAAGYLTLTVGIAMLVLPGPAFIVIPIGLGILAAEVQWARRLLERFKEKFTAAKEAAQKKKKGGSS